jgi:hypothetical protein
MRIEQGPSNCGEQRTWTNTPRIVTYVRDDLRSITAGFRACYFC